MTSAARLELGREPTEISLPLLPDHRVLRVLLHNPGDAPVEVRRSLTRLLDERGEDLRAASRPPILRLVPGGSAPLDLVFRVREGTGPPAWLEHAGERVALAWTPAAPTSARRA